MALRVEKRNYFTISGRGECASVLIETIRREGFDWSWTTIVITINEDGVKRTDWRIASEVGSEFISWPRARATTLKMKSRGWPPLALLVWHLPTRRWLVCSILLTAAEVRWLWFCATDINRLAGKVLKNPQWVLIAFEAGTTTPYALQAAEARGELLVGPGTEVYAGMIVGIYNRQKTSKSTFVKQRLTNMRSSRRMELCNWRHRNLAWSLSTLTKTTSFWKLRQNHYDFAKRPLWTQMNENAPRNNSCVIK